MPPYNAGIYFVKTGSTEGDLRLNEGLNGAAATQNCLENTKDGFFGNIGQV